MITVCIVGLGYVGLPLAQEFSKYYRTIGYRRNQSEINKLNSHHGNRIEGTTDPKKVRQADFVIIAVPTPVTESKEPNLEPVISAAELIGKNMKPGATVILESTVYPGVTENIVIPKLESSSGWVCGKDFFVGYSPERTNPGDAVHTLKNTVKVVAGMDEPTTKRIAELYGTITSVYRAPDIKTAEAAKIIENIQRDLNIALMNEFSIICSKLGLNTKEVLDAAGTKWNFHNYMPGLVGGHCIPVDPYYLVHKARELGYHTQVISAGRSVNDSMPKYVAELTIKGLNETGKRIPESDVLIMGLTYKENVADTRESPARGIIQELHEYHVNVFGMDPHLSETDIEEFGIHPYRQEAVDGIIITVAHNQFRILTVKELVKMMRSNSVLIDVRGIVNRFDIAENNIYYKTL